MRERILKYWKSPDDGTNEPWMYLRPRNWYRSIHLYSIISDLISAAEQPRILEIGCNIGRNLMTLRFGDYIRLFGIELSERAVEVMRIIFPLSDDFKIYTGEVERWIPTLKTDSFDIVFTMAVLQHLPPESEHVFKQLVRITKRYLVVIEDEKRQSWRHFPRRYDEVFKPLGLKQIKVIKKIDGLSKPFKCRIFRKGEK